MGEALADGFRMLRQGDIIRLVVSIVLFGVCIFLFRRKRSLPSTLLLLG